MSQDRKPIFCIELGRYYVAMWNFELLPHLSMFGLGGDTLWLLWRMESEPTKWHLGYRFRHKRDEKVWGSADVKHVFEQVMENPDEADVLATTQFLIEQMCQMGGRNLDRMLVQGNCDAFIKKITTHAPDWLHMQTERVA